MRSPARRAVRSRAASGSAGAKTTDSKQQRRLSSQINQSMAQAANRPLEITPIDIPLSSLSSTLTPLGARAAIGPSSFQSVAPALDAKSIREMLRSPQKLREIAILSEVLRPPVALRQGADRTEPTSLCGRTGGRLVKNATRFKCARLSSRCDCREKADFRSTANGLARSVFSGGISREGVRGSCAAILHSRQLQ